MVRVWFWNLVVVRMVIPPRTWVLFDQSWIRLSTHSQGILSISHFNYGGTGTQVYASFINFICHSTVHCIFSLFIGESSYERRGKKKSSQFMFSNHFVDGMDASCLSIFSSIEHRASKFAFMVTWYGGVFFSWLDQIASSTPWYEPAAYDIKQKNFWTRIQIYLFVTFRPNNSACDDVSKSPETGTCRLCQTEY